jgi:hypothetical protein
MNTDDSVQNKDVLLKLLNTETAEQVAQLVDNEMLFKNCLWKPYGNTENNARSVEGQMKSSSNALVEKITNSTDALLMRRCYEVDGVEPESGDIKLPKTLSEAIARYFGSEEEIDKNRSEWARQHLVILADGDKKKPTITVIDRGEGQFPDRIQETIVGLNESIKEKINFVFGKYHQGGSAALRFCGSKGKCYQLVLSRRAETLVKNGVQNDWGFTLVRRNYKNRIAYYEYAVTKEGRTFSFPYDKPIKIQDLEIDFIDGCLVRLYDYYLDNPSNITYGFSSLGFDINQKLQKAPLPIYLQDNRAWKGDTKYTIAGLLKRVEDNKKIINHDITLPAGLGEIGTRNIRCICLKHVHDEESVKTLKQEREKIFYTENGLALGYETESFLRTECQLPALAPYLICYVDMSDIPVDLANIFHAGREEFAHTEDYKNLKIRLKNFFENEMFEKWDKEYQEKNMSDSNGDNKELDKLIEKAITDSPELKELLGIGEEITTPKGKDEEEEEYKGDETPKKFEYIGEQPKDVEKISYAVVSFKTEAEDKLLTRRKDRYKIEWSGDSKIFDVMLRGMKKGIISMRVDCKSGVNVNDTDKIGFSLSDSEGKNKFEQIVTFKVTEAPPYVGLYFPTKFESQKQLIKIFPNTRKKYSLKTDAVNDYFERANDMGKIEFVQNSELQIKKWKLNDGNFEISLYTSIGEYRRLRENLKFTISDGKPQYFDFDIPIEIVPLEESSKLNQPQRNPIYKDKWDEFNPTWDENNVSDVVASKTKGLIVNINMDAKPMQDLAKIVGVEKRENAKNRYIADVYIYSLFLYFELKNDSTLNNQNKDQILASAMKGIGKALPGIISKFV